MEQRELTLEHFLADIGPDFHQQVNQLDKLLTGLGCTVKLQEAKSGHVISYNHGKGSKVVANFVSRKSGPVVRIYGDHAGEYPDFFDTIPDKMAQKISKTGPCKRMLDPTKCNSRCSMGYDFILKGERQQKCKYNCFMLPITADNLPYLQAFLQRELECRTA